MAGADEGCVGVEVAAHQPWCVVLFVEMHVPGLSLSKFCQYCFSRRIHASALTMMCGMWCRGC